jgi:signal transduction histidine kinase
VADVKILIADDDPVSLETLEASLRRWRYDFVSVNDGHEAWRALLEDLDIGVAILDWHMPGVDGADLCRLAREVYGERSLYVLLLSARGGAEAMLEGFKAGADDFLAKPVSPDELRARLDVGIRVAGLQRALGERVTDLEAAERRYRELVDDADVVVWEAEPEPWSYRFISKRAVELIGEAATRFVDDREAWMTQVVPSDRPAVEAFRRDLVSGAPHATCEYRMLDERGRTLYLRDLARPAVSEVRGPRRVRGVTIDMTLQRQAREQIQAAAKVQADFVNFASHQLRTPLTGIKWMLELAMAEPDGSPDLRGFLHDSRDASERLIVLVNDLLSISRLEGGRLSAAPSLCDLSELTSRVVSELHAVGRKLGHSIWTFGLDGKHAVLADAKLLHEVLQNLLSNAIKYTPPKGRIWINVERRGDEECWSVTDDGIGVPEEARPRLFEKFFRADNVTKVDSEGTGLGLYMVRLIVEQANGRIWYEPAEHGGSRFVVALPTATPVTVVALPGETGEPAPAQEDYATLLSRAQALLRAGLTGESESADLGTTT